MSFTTGSTFSTNYRSLGSIQKPSYGAQLVSNVTSVYTGAGGSGSQISRVPLHQLLRWNGVQGPSHKDFRGSGRNRRHPGREGAMQSLNDHLASYLDRVMSLETENRKLESKTWEHLEKKGSQVRDCSHYFKTIKDLRAQIFTNTVDNAYIVQCPSCSAAGDRDRGSQGEAAHHEEEVKGLQAQIASSGSTVEVDAPKSQDLAKIMADIQAQYDKLAQKNQEELDKYWSQQIEESTTVLTTQSTELGAADTSLVLGDRPGLHEKSEGQLGEQPEGGRGLLHLQMEQLNGILLHLESELTQTRAEGQR
ncbi:Keratin, type I cytoskeletal 18 [Plecturocebus cupreus]